MPVPGGGVRHRPRAWIGTETQTGALMPWHRLSYITYDINIICNVRQSPFIDSDAPSVRVLPSGDRRAGLTTLRIAAQPVQNAQRAACLETAAGFTATRLSHQHHAGKVRTKPPSYRLVLSSNGLVPAVCDAHAHDVLWLHKTEPGRRRSTPPPRKQQFKLIRCRHLSKREFRYRKLSGMMIVSPGSSGRSASMSPLRTRSSRRRR